MLFFMRRLCGGSPAGVSLFRNSTGYLEESLGLLVLSTLDRMLLQHAIVLANWWH